MPETIITEFYYHVDDNTYIGDFLEKLESIGENVLLSYDYPNPNCESVYHVGNCTIYTKHTIGLSLRKPGNISIKVYGTLDGHVEMLLKELEKKSTGKSGETGVQAGIPKSMGQNQDA